MSEKKYPPTVTLRKIWIGLAVVGAFCLALVILYNLYHSASMRSQSNVDKAPMIQTVANTSDMNWYHTKKALLQPPQTTTSETVHAPLKTLEKPDDDKHVATDPDRAKEAKEAKEAMNAAINSNQLTGELLAKAGENTLTMASKSSLKNPASPYVIQAGTLIPGILMTGINSDLPGHIIGQVRSNVYDSITGRYVLIPQGSKIIGVYDAKIIYGQARVLVAWQRLLLPNGQSLALGDMAGVDNSGYTGFNDQVNAHYRKLFSSALLMSVLGAGAHLSQPQSGPLVLAGNPLTQAFSQNLAGSVMTTASELTSKNMSLQPTLDIRPGFTFNILVTNDIAFPKPYSDKCNEER